MQSVAGSRLFVGRAAELEVLRKARAAAVAGRGDGVWVEGEAGIGKSSLVREGLSEAGAAGCAMYWGTADRLRTAFPLGVMLDCLAVSLQSADPLRAEIARTLRGEHAVGLLGGGDLVVAAADRLCELVDRLCTASPVVIVIDDLPAAARLPPPGGPPGV